MEYKPLDNACGVKHPMAEIRLGVIPSGEDNNKREETAWRRHLEPLGEKNQNPSLGGRFHRLLTAAAVV